MHVPLNVYQRRASRGEPVSIATQPGVYCASMGSTGQQGLAGGRVVWTTAPEWVSEVKLSLADRIVITDTRQVERKIKAEQEALKATVKSLKVEIAIKLLLPTC